MWYDEIAQIAANYKHVDDVRNQILKLKESYFFWWMPNHQTGQYYCRYEMDTLCLLQIVYECQTQKLKGGKPWKSHKLQKSGSITIEGRATLTGWH